MYIITNGRSNIYHLAVRTNASKETYATACGYYTYVLPGGQRVMLVDKVADDRRLCKACEAADNRIHP